MEDISYSGTGTPKKGGGGGTSIIGGSERPKKSKRNSDRSCGAGGRSEELRSISPLRCFKKIQELKQFF